MTPNAWAELATDYEQARQRPDSLDRILEWPAQREVLGDVTGQRILDVGCGNGAKSVALADDGAAEVLGIDITDTFMDHDHDNVHLTGARKLLAPGGQILVQLSHPVRYALERAEANGTSLGEEYYSTQRYTYRSGWNPSVSLTHSNETVSTILNTFAGAGLTIDAAIEPELTPEAQQRYPHKHAWLNKHLGVLIFILSVR